MRISTSIFFEQGVQSMQQHQAELVRQQQLLSSGRRALTPADDPVATTRALEVKQSQALNQQYDINAGNAQSQLGLEEQALKSVVNLLQDVKVLALNANNAPLGNNDRLSIATDLRGRFEELLGLANSTDGNGQYLFSGYQGSNKAFSEVAPGYVVYNGDQGQRMVQVSPSQQIAISDSGSDVFQRIRNGNGNFVTSAARMSTTAATANTGTGKISTVSVSGPPYNTNLSQPVTITFTSPTTFDVTGTGTGLPATGVSYTAGAPISYNGWTASITGVPATGDVFNIAPNAGTGIISVGVVNNQSAWNAATNKNLSIRFAVDNTVTPAVTTYDIVNNVTGNSLLTGAAASNFGPYARTYSAGTAISLKSQGAEPAFDYGASVEISGVPANGDTFNVAASSSTDIFTTLSNLITALQTPVTSGAGTASLNNSLNTALKEIDNSIEQVLTVEASVGARLRAAEVAQSTGQDLALQYQQTLSNLQDLDYAKAISDLNFQQMQLDAAQKSFMQVQSLSLFNYL
ncbi:MAG: flagellar hook-associated protein FlgL [Pseudomonadota bacterium]